MKIFETLCASMVLSVCAAGLAAAEDEATPKSFLGDWAGPCDAWGVPATCTSKWTRGLHSKHLIQNYSIVREADDALIFAGRGVYQFEGTAVRGAWEGSNGAIHPITGTFDEAALSVIWGTPETEIGRSDYSIVDGQLSVSDFVLSPSGWREFMTVEYDLEQN